MIYHHIGIYCYSTETLEKFVKLKQSKNEIKKTFEKKNVKENPFKVLKDLNLR